MIERETKSQYNLSIILGVIDIIYNKEIVFRDNKFYIYNGTKPDTELPLQTTILFSFGILVHDSGNFDTGEQCFIVERDRKKLKEKIVNCLKIVKTPDIESFIYLIRDKKITQILES